MKADITRFFTVAAITSLVMVLGSSIAWAACPASPNYVTDFSSDQTCLTLNGTTPGYPGFYPAVTGTGTVLRVVPNTSYAAGSAWFNTQQPVSGIFSTNFTFQISGDSGIPADGFAFVIQAAGTSALGPDGCGLGFADSSSGCTPSTGGIPRSLAVVFNTYLDSGVDTTNNSVSIQNCSGTSANSVDPSCTVPGGVNNSLPSTLADGQVHFVTISYSGPSTKLLDVILDGHDLFPGGIAFDLTSIGLNSGGTAFVGFTSATGYVGDNHDIRTWTFSPTSQSTVISLNVPSVLSFPNAAGDTAYDFTAQLTSPYPTPVIKVKPILMTQAACDALVQKNFWPARCFVYQNAENSGMDASVLFEVTCPDSPGGTCGSNEDENFFAQLGTDFAFSYLENPFFIYPGISGLLNPRPGFLKGEGPNSLDPCDPPATDPLFNSNQVNTFFIDGGHTTGGSAGGASCWVATYDMPYAGEVPPGIQISSPVTVAYKQGSVVTAKYTCSDPSTSKPTSSPTGPYLTVATCTQSEIPAASSNANSCNSAGGQIVCTGPVDTSTVGPHTFFVSSVDSGSNRNVRSVTYIVKKH